LTIVWTAVLSKHSAGVSFQCVVALTPLANTLAIYGEFLSCSVDAGFVLALPLTTETLKTRSFD